MRARKATGTPAKDKRLLTMDEAADVMSIGYSSLLKLIEQGRIISVKIGDARRVPLVAIDKYIEQLMQEQGA